MQRRLHTQALKCKTSYRQPFGVGAILSNTRGWMRRDKLAARRMYLVQGLSPKEIALKLDRSDSSIHCLVTREGWAKQRRAHELAAASKADEAAGTAAKEFVESVAAQAQELTEAGFDLARSAAEVKDAKEFAFAANGTKAFVHLARVAMGLDGAQAKQQSQGLSLNVILARPVTSAEQRVAPASEPQTVSTSNIQSMDTGETLEFE